MTNLFNVQEKKIELHTIHQSRTQLATIQLLSLDRGENSGGHRIELHNGGRVIGKLMK